MFDWHYFFGLFPTLAEASLTTLGMTLVAGVISLILGLIFALIQLFKVPALNSVVKVWLSFFRGTPLIVQLFLIYYGLPQIFPSLVNMTAIQAAIIGLVCHFSSYMAESYRGSLQSVPSLQWEACWSLGMSRAQAVRRVILPQSLPGAIPPLMNNLIDLFKSTSLAFTLSVIELMGAAKLEAASSLRFFETYIAVALCYWFLVSLASWGQKHIELKLSQGWRIDRA